MEQWGSYLLDITNLIHKDHGSTQDLLRFKPDLVPGPRGEWIPKQESITTDTYWQWGNKISLLWCHWVCHWVSYGLCPGISAKGPCGTPMLTWAACGWARGNWASVMGTQAHPTNLRHGGQTKGCRELYPVPSLAAGLALGASGTFKLAPSFLIHETMDFLKGLSVLQNSSSDVGLNWFRCRGLAGGS